LRVERIIWVPDIVDKLATKHGVILTEVEEVLRAQPFIRRMKRGHRPGEDVYAALGQTMAGRYLIVFFVYKKTQEALVVSARDMDQGERRSYEHR
jgi:uncharacterized DUF497 family protein